MGPSKHDPISSDPYVMSLRLNQKQFMMGSLYLRPLKTKPEQIVNKGTMVITCTLSICQKPKFRGGGGDGVFLTESKLIFTVHCFIMEFSLTHFICTDKLHLHIACRQNFRYWIKFMYVLVTLLTTLSLKIHSMIHILVYDYTQTVLLIYRCFVCSKGRFQWPFTEPRELWRLGTCFLFHKVNSYYKGLQLLIVHVINLNVKSQSLEFHLKSLWCNL